MKQTILISLFLCLVHCTLAQDTTLARQQLVEAKSLLASKSTKNQKIEALLQGAEKAFRSVYTDQNAPVLCQIAFLKGNLYFESGDNPKAAENYKDCITCKKALNETEHFHVLKSLASLAFIENQSNHYEQSDSLFALTLALARKTLPEKDSYWGILWSDKAVFLTDRQQSDSALIYLNRAIPLLKKAEKWGNLASAFHNKARVLPLRESLIYYDSAFLLYEKIENYEGQTSCLSGKGYTLRKMGDFDQAITSYEKALQLVFSFDKKNYRQLFNLYNNLGVSYRRLKDCDKAQEYYQKAIENATYLYGKKSAQIADILTNIGNCNTQTGKPDIALGFYEKALAIRKEVLPEKHPRRALNYFAMAWAYEVKGDDIKSFEYACKGMKINELLYESPHPRLGDTYMDIGSRCTNLGRRDEALEYFEKAEKAFAFYPENPQRFLLTNNPNYLLSCLGAKVTAYQFKATESKEMLYHEKALKTAYQAMDLVDFLRSSFASESSKKLLLDLAVKELFLYQNGINSAYILYENTGKESYIQQAYAISERCKAILMQEHIGGQKAAIASGIPDSLLTQIQSLESSVASLEKERFKKAELPEKDSTKLAVAAELFEAKDKLKKQVAAVRENNPRYVDFLKNNKAVQQADIIAALPPKTALIDFFVVDSSSYIFVLDESGQRNYVVTAETTLRSLTAQLRAGTYGYFSLPEQQRTQAVYDSLNQQFATASHTLFQTLIEPLGGLPENIIIVPSDVLGYVPFEALLTEQPSDANAFKTHQYLGAKHRISYCPSAALFIEMQEKRVKNDALAAFAPIFKENEAAQDSLIAMRTRAALGPLAWTEKEAKSIGQITGGDVYLSKRANKEMFLKSLSTAGFLHLATHAKLDDKNSDFSYLAFNGADTERDTGKVYVRELYAQQLDLQMAVLSACETGLGELQSGEGIMSLARGFTYAGAKSVIMSLWEVNDKATSDIMTDFYKNLHLGQPKHVALWNAKSSYLEAQPEDRLAHPFYWASFVAMGDMQPVEIGQDFPFGWFAALLGVFAFGWFFFKYNKERRMNL